MGTQQEGPLVWRGSREKRPVAICSPKYYRAYTPDSLHHARYTQKLHIRASSLKRSIYLFTHTRQDGQEKSQLRWLLKKENKIQER